MWKWCSWAHRISTFLQDAWTCPKYLLLSKNLLSRRKVRHVHRWLSYQANAKSVLIEVQWSMWKYGLASFSEMLLKEAFMELDFESQSRCYRTVGKVQSERKPWSEQESRVAMLSIFRSSESTDWIGEEWPTGNVLVRMPGQNAELWVDPLLTVIPCSEISAMLFLVSDPRDIYYFCHT